MKHFNELEKLKENEFETQVNEYWNKIDILNKTIENREGCEDFVFYDGPATANPVPVKRYVALI